MSSVTSNQLDFIVIGAQKSASTFVQRALEDHPEVMMPKGELSYFEDPWYDPAGFDGFLRAFRAARPGQRVGFKRPDLLGVPACTERVQARFPNANLVCILRHPVDRAVSAYFHFMRYDALPLCDVETGMRAILDGSLRGWPYAEKVLHYGCYAEHLQRWFSRYPREQVQVLLHDDIVADPVGKMAEVYAFLGVDAAFRSRNLNRRSQAVIYSLPRLRFLRLRSPLVFRWYAERTGWTWRWGELSRGIWYGFEAMDRWGWGRFLENPKPVLSDALRGELAAYYREDVAGLRDLLPALPIPWEL